jgi:hypothetical protein
MTSIKYLSFQDFGQKSEMTQLAEGNCPGINANELTHITNVNYMINDLEKFIPIIGYIDETVFERQYERIA